MVDVVGDVAGEAPVVAAVLEQVHDRHRSVGEPMDEDGLQQALCIVANPEGKDGITFTSTFRDVLHTRQHKLSAG